MTDQDWSQNPSQVVSLVKQYRQNSNDERLLNTLTNIAADPACWPYLRDEDIIDLFTDLVLNRVPRDKDEQNVCLYLSY